MKYSVVLIGVLAALVSLSGCRAIRNVGGTCHDPKPYMKASSVAPLKIPPGLDTPDTANALHIPVLNQPDAPARKATDPCLVEPPPFNVPKPAPPQA